MKLRSLLAAAFAAAFLAPAASRAEEQTTWTYVPTKDTANSATTIDGVTITPSYAWVDDTQTYFATSDNSVQIGKRKSAVSRIEYTIPADAFGKAVRSVELVAKAAATVANAADANKAKVSVSVGGVQLSATSDTLAKDHDSIVFSAERPLVGEFVLSISNPLAENNSTSYAIYVRSISVVLVDMTDEPSGPVALAAPTGLVKSNIGENGFTLSWSDVENAAGYEVEVLDSAGVAAGQVAVSGASAVVTGISSGTAYTVRVKALAAEGSEDFLDSAWSTGVEVETTLSGGLAKKDIFKETFDNVPGTGWNKGGAISNTDETWTPGDNALRGPKGIRLGTGEKPGQITTRNINIETTASSATVTLSFRAASYSGKKTKGTVTLIDAATGEETKILDLEPAVMTNSTSDPLEGGTEYNESITVPATFRIRFESLSSASDKRLMLDDVVITQIYDPNYAALQAPGNVAASEVGKASFAVSWDAVTGATGYEVWVDGERSQTTAAAVTSATVSGLEDGTVYSVQVRALGDGLHAGDSPLSAALQVTTEEDASAVVFAVVGAPTEEVYAGDVVSFTVTAAVESTGAAASVAFSGIAGATYDPATGAFAWTPAEADVGTHVATFASGEYSRTVTLEVVSSTVVETIKTEEFSKISSTSWITDNRYNESVDGDIGSWTGVDITKTKAAIIIGRVAKVGYVQSPAVELKPGALGSSVSFETGALPDMKDDKTASIKVSIVDAETGTALVSEKFSDLPKLDSDAKTVAQAGAAYTVSVPSGTQLPSAIAVRFESVLDDSKTQSGRVYVDTVSFVQTVSAKVKDLATPANFALSGDAGENGFAVTFGAVPGATNYEVRVLDASGEAVGTAVVDSEALSATVSGLVDDADYTVQVRATGDAAKYYASPWSEPLAVRTARSALHPTLGAIVWQNEVNDGKLYASIANNATLSVTLEEGAPGVVSGVRLVSVSPAPADEAAAPSLSGYTLSWTPTEDDAKNKKTFTLVFEVTVAPTDGTAARKWKFEVSATAAALPALSAPTLALDADSLEWNSAKFTWNKPFRAVRYSLRVWSGASDPDATGNTWGEDFESYPVVVPVGWEFDGVPPANAYKTYAGVHVGFKASGVVTSPEISGTIDTLSFKIKSVSGKDSTLTVAGWNGTEWVDLASYTGDDLSTSTVTKTIENLGGAYGRFRWTFEKAGSNLAFGSVEVGGFGLPTAKVRTLEIADATTTTANVVPFYGVQNWASITAYDADGNAKPSSVIAFTAPDMPQSVRATVLVFR